MHAVHYFHFYPVLVLVAFLALPASAAEKIPREHAVGNFFSASAADQARPAVARRPAPSDPVARELVEVNPTIEQMRLIPSLNAAQLKQLNPLFNVYRTDMKALKEQLKALRLDFKMRLAAKNNQEKLPPLKEAEDPAIVVVLEQVKARRQKMTDDIAAIVSVKQMEELEAIKRGKVPAYLNTAGKDNAR
jgi:hypothetical protein